MGQLETVAVVVVVVNPFRQLFLHRKRAQDHGDHLLGTYASTYIRQKCSEKCQICSGELDVSGLAFFSRWT